MELGELVHEGLGLGVGSVHGKGGQHHNTLQHSHVGDLGLQAVQAVAAKDLDAVQLALSLGQEHGSLSGIDGQEHQIAAGITDGVDLGGEIRLGALGEGLLGDDGQTPLGRLSSEGLHQTGRVVDIGLIEHGDFAAQLVVSDVVGGGSTLCRVVEADTEGLVVALNALLGRGGTGDDEYVVVLGGGDDGLGLAGQHAAQRDVHLIVHQLTKGRDGGVGIALRVLGLQLELPAVDAAGGIDLLHSHLSAVTGGGTVVGIVTGHGADEAQQQSLVASAAVAVIAALAAASGQQSGKHTQGYENCGHLFHLSYLLVVMCFCPYTRQIAAKVSENGKFAEKFFFFCSV